MPKINGNWPWPTDLVQRRTFKEELRTGRALEKNIQASPMPSARPEKLLAPKTSSEHLRMADGRAPQARTEQTATPTSVGYIAFRRVLARRKKKGTALFDSLVEEEDLGDDVPEERRAKMRNMLARERAMHEILGRYAGLAEELYSRLLGESKG